MEPKKAQQAKPVQVVKLSLPTKESVVKVIMDRSNTIIRNIDVQAKEQEIRKTWFGSEFRRAPEGETV